MDKDVREILPARVANTLKRHGIVTLREYVSKVEEEGTIAVRNLGKVGEKIILDVLRTQGIEINMKKRRKTKETCPNCGHKFWTVK